MRIEIERFTSNNPNLKLEDVVKNFKLGTTESDVINFWFQTEDKYVYVDSDTSFTGGRVVTISPIIYNCNTHEEIDRYDDFDAYFNHPDYWSVSIAIHQDNKQSYLSIVTPLKHEYFVTFVPHGVALDYDCLEPARY